MATTTESTVDPMAASMDHWRQWWRLARAINGASFEAARLFLDPRPVRERWLGELSRQFDVYLRSPAFLQLMGSSNDLMSKSLRFFVPPSRK